MAPRVLSCRKKPPERRSSRSRIWYPRRSSPDRKPCLLPSLLPSRLQGYQAQLLKVSEIGSLSLDIMRVTWSRPELLRKHRMVNVEDFVVISWCSGGGKSTLLDALEDLGHHIVKEPGRRIVTEEMAISGSALPWDDPVAFARRVIRLSLADRECSRQRSGWVFFD